MGAEPTVGPPLACAHPESFRSRSFLAADYVTGDPFEVQTCRACGLSFTHPQPTPDQLHRYYPQAYYGDASHRRFPGPVEWLQGLLYRIRAKRIEAALGTGPGRILDIGCGKGHLLHAFQSRGWAATGVELSEATAQLGRDMFGLTIHAGPLDAHALPGDSFEVAVLWHVLEHMPEPDALLGEVARLLVPGGLLLVSVPDLGSPEARATGPAWFHLDVPRHLIQFTRQQLRAALARAGFEQRDSWSYAPEFDLFSFIQSTENRLGLPQNLLYRMLRGSSARLPGLRVTPWQRVAAMFLALPLGLLGLPWTLLAGPLRLGSTVTLLVRKPGPVL